MTAAAPAPPPLDAGLEQLLRRMRLPHMRRVAPEVIATAKAQRWDPAEILRALLAEEVAGRDKSSLATRRARAAFPTGKTFDAWDVLAHSLSGLAIQLQGTRKLADREGVSTGLRATIERSAELTKAGLADARQAVSALRGERLPTLDQLGALIEGFRATSAQTPRCGSTGRPGHCRPRPASPCSAAPRRR